MFLGAAAYCWYLIAISIKAYLNYEVRSREALFNISLYASTQ